MVGKPYLLRFPLPTDTGELEPVVLDPALYMTFGQAVMQTTGEGTPSDQQVTRIKFVANLMTFGAVIAKRESLSEPEARRLKYTFEYFLKIATVERWSQPTDPASSLCYYLVHNRYMTYREAFDLEQTLLETKRSRPPDAGELKVFRRRLTRWAAAPQRKLEKVAPIGRPRKQKASD